MLIKLPNLFQLDGDRRKNLGNLRPRQRPNGPVPPYFFIRKEIKRKLARKNFKFSIMNMGFYILIHNHNICIYVSFISLKYHHKNKIIVSKLHCTNMLIGEQFKQKFDKVHPFLKLNYCLNCLVKIAQILTLSPKKQFICGYIYDYI